MITRFRIGAEEMVGIRCGSCAVTHALPAIIYDTARLQGGYWHCPNGHSRGWARGENQEELAVARRDRDRLRQENARLADESIAEARKRIAAETKLKRYTKRTAAGLCPCCNRSFRQLKAHLKSKHPDYNVVPLKAS